MHITNNAAPLEFSNTPEGRQAYANTLKTCLAPLKDQTLKDVSSLYEKVSQDVSRDLLVKAEKAAASNSVRYYLWSKNHPRLDTFFRVITCGLMHFVAEKGAARCKKHGPIIDIAQSVGIIRCLYSEKESQWQQLHETITQQTSSYETFSPTKVLALLNEQEQKGGKKTDCEGILRSFLHRNTRTILNQPQTFLDNTYYNDLIVLWNRVKADDATSATLQQTKGVYILAQDWSALNFNTKLELLETMQKHPQRFEPILQQIISETEKCLTWDHFSTKPSQERQEIITQVNILLDMPNLEATSTLSDAMRHLREYIQTSYFKECDWNNEDVVVHLEGVCQNLDIVDECAIAKDTAFLEANWDECDVETRIENTSLLVEDEKHYAKELERRRKEVFAIVEGLLDRPIDEFEYTLHMLRELKPVFTKGCTQALKSIKEQLLAQIEAAVQAGTPREDLISKAQLIGINQKILEELAPQGWISSALAFLYTGKSKSARLQEAQQAVTADLLHRRHKLRELGVPTPIARVPTNEDVAKFRLSESHLKVAPPTIGPLAYKSKITELNDLLKEADKQQLIPRTLTESTSDRSSLCFNKNELMQKLSSFLQSLENTNLNARLTKVRDVLGAYTDQLKERLKAANTPNEKRDIYNELVELVCKEMGFACYHCEDRKLMAAMLIFNEKLVANATESGSAKQKVLEWLAKKRDALASNILQEMVQHNIAHARDSVFYDVSSSISRWRHVLRRQLGLGDVPAPAHSIDSGLSENQIMNRFNQTYTTEWILEQAMEEHAKENGNSALKIGAINEYLESRISNFDDLKYDLLDEESYKLLKGAMALYLQEIGVFNPIL